MNKIRILICEDNTSDATLMQRELRKAGFDFEAELAIDKKSFDSALNEFVPELILADYSVPGFDGLAALNLARQRFADIPVIIVSGAIGEEQAIESLKAGATDYVLKDKLSKLGPAVVRAINETKELAEKKLAMEALQNEKSILNTIMESTNAHLAYLNRELNFVVVNSTYAKGSGHSKEELIGRNHFEFFPSTENEANFKKVRDTGKAMEFEAKPFKFVDQPWRGVTYWDWTLMPVKDKADQVTGLVLSLVNVTESIRAKELSDGLNKINHIIGSTLDFDKIMQGVTNESINIINTESAAIALFEEDKLVVRYLSGKLSEHSKELLGIELSAKQLENSDIPPLTGEPLIIKNTHQSKGFIGNLIKKYNAKSILSMPLVVKRGAIGLIAFIYHSEEVDFSPLQVDFAKKLSTSVSLAMENARLYEEEHRVSETLQEALLVPPVKIEGVDMGYLYRPATEEARVGGDFYDVFELTHNEVGIIVGDVSGKGLDAATTTSLVRNTIKAYSYDITSPAAVMTKTNEVVRKATTPGLFVTVVFAILNCKTGELTYCNSGHPHPIIKRKTGEAMFIDKGSPVIGILTKQKFLDAKKKLQKGDSLILYTDGITEARRKKDFFGDERLIKFIIKQEFQPAKKLTDAIFKEVITYASGKLPDDIVLLTLQLKA